MGPPDVLDECGRAKWSEILPALLARGDVDQGTLDALTCYCGAWSQWVEAGEHLRTEGAIVATPQGKFPSPWCAIQKAAQVALRQWANELRLTPRTRGAKTKPATADPVARAMGRGA